MGFAPISERSSGLAMRAPALMPETKKPPLDPLRQENRINATACVKPDHRSVRAAGFSFDRTNHGFPEMPRKGFDPKTEVE